MDRESRRFFVAYPRVVEVVLDPGLVRPWGTPYVREHAVSVLRTLRRAVARAGGVRAKNVRIRLCGVPGGPGEALGLFSGHSV